ncbi:MAG: arginine deiminase-related protein, partial [Ornithinimicrobium sp.]
MTSQAPSAAVLIRPHHFAPNPATAIDNAFQSEDHSRSPEQIAADAYTEVSGVADALREAGVKVHVFESTDATHPDSVFPNNWFSTHAGGYVAIYPMHSESRRIERRSDIIEMLKRDYRVQEVADYSGLEYDRIFLEGTGAMVL